MQAVVLGYHGAKASLTTAFVVDRITELTVGGGTLGTGDTVLPQPHLRLALPLPLHVPRPAGARPGPATSLGQLEMSLDQKCPSMFCF